MLKMESTIAAEKDPEVLNPDPIELFTAPIPGAGIAVKGIFSIGLTVAYDVGTSATISGTATVDFGLEATLPDGAMITADISNPGQSSATGWVGSSLDPIFEVTKLEADITLAAYSQPKVEFGITLDNVGDVAIVVGVKLPEISSTLSAVYGESPLHALASYCFTKSFSDQFFALKFQLQLFDVRDSLCKILTSSSRSKRRLQSNSRSIQNRRQARKQSRHLRLPIHRSKPRR